MYMYGISSVACISCRPVGEGKALVESKVLELFDLHVAPVRAAATVCRGIRSQTP